jgi:hypothetical protein
MKKKHERKEGRWGRRDEREIQREEGWEKKIGT